MSFPSFPNFPNYKTFLDAFKEFLHNPLYADKFPDYAKERQIYSIDDNIDVKYIRHFIKTGLDPQVGLDMMRECMREIGKSVELIYIDCIMTFVNAGASYIPDCTIDKCEHCSLEGDEYYMNCDCDLNMCDRCFGYDDPVIGCQCDPRSCRGAKSDRHYCMMSDCKGGCGTWACGCIDVCRDRSHWDA